MAAVSDPFEDPSGFVLPSGSVLSGLVLSGSCWVGSDLVTQIPRWYKIKDLLAEVDLLVVPRPGYNIQDGDLAELRELGGRVAIADWQGLDVSSTDFRQAGNPNPIPPKVQAYIDRENLYQSSLSR